MSGQAATAPRSFGEAIGLQPRNLAGAFEAFHEAASEVDLQALCEGTLVLSGIGASAHALVPAVLALRAAGRRAFAVSSAELRSAQAAGLGDAFVLVSQSGASAETVAALQAISGAPVVAISARGDSPLASAAGVWLPLGPIPDTPVATLSYTATLQALGMLCETLLGGMGDVWARLPELAREVLERAEEAVEAAAQRFAHVRSLDAVGAGSALASAGETMLLAREALRIPATAMETREYLHGPLEAVDATVGCVVFGGPRERDLTAELTSYEAPVALLTDADPGDLPAAVAIELPRVPDLAAPILQILPIQLLVDRLARARGLEIGKLRRHQHDTKVA